MTRALPHPAPTAASTPQARGGLRGLPGPILAMGALALACLAIVGWQRLAPQPVASSESRAPVLWQRSLHFEDRPNGDVAVLEAGSRTEVAVMRGEQGFLRGTLRMLARERARRGLGPAQPFTLVAYADGRLTLADAATGERIHLESFGPANAGVFAALRDTRGTPPTSSRTSP